MKYDLDLLEDDETKNEACNMFLENRKVNEDKEIENISNEEKTEYIKVFNSIFESNNMLNYKEQDYIGFNIYNNKQLQDIPGEYYLNNGQYTKYWLSSTQKNAKKYVIFHAMDFCGRPQVNGGFTSDVLYAIKPREPSLGMV